MDEWCPSFFCDDGWSGFSTLDDPTQKKKKKKKLRRLTLFHPPIWILSSTRNFRFTFNQPNILFLFVVSNEDWIDFVNLSTIQLTLQFQLTSIGQEKEPSINMKLQLYMTIIHASYLQTIMYYHIIYK